MKIKSILVSMLAFAALASCTKDKTDGTRTTTDPDYSAAYMAISVKAPSEKGPTRGSSENPTQTGEGDITSLYVITYDNLQKLVHHSDSTPVIELTSNLDQPQAVKISASAKYLLVIANPGAELKKVIDAAYVGQTYTDFNMAITQTLAVGSKPETLVNELVKFTNRGAANQAVTNFTMINSGKVGTVDDGLITIETAKLQQVGDTANGSNYHANDTDAATAAKGDPQEIRIERLTAKIRLKAAVTKVQPVDLATPANSARFTFGGWALDVLNSTYYPYAKKEKTASNTHSGSFYTQNFYTVDPNFSGNAGIHYNKINATTLTPEVNWLVSERVDYSIENTMESSEQRYKNATRVVIKGTYYPVGTWTEGSDWYSFLNDNFQTLELLQNAYDEAVAAGVAADPTNPQTNAQKALIDACDKMYDVLKNKNAVIAGAAADFTKLTQAMLDANVTANGGELLKDDGCIKWYQKGVNYYWYEIQHDKDATANMEFSKYGVVRNNFYDLTITSVKGKGKPWYPGVDPTDPDPEGPKPEDPIDEDFGWLGIELEIGPWVYWTYDDIEI